MLSKLNLNNVYYGWLIVGIGCILFIYDGGVVVFGFTAVFEPLVEEFNWSYAQVSLAASLRGAERGLAAPLMGMIADRWNPRKLMYAGIIIAGLGLLLFSRINSLGMLYATTVLIALGMSAYTGPVYYKILANWFRGKLTLVIGIVTCGFALGGLMVPVITHLISLYGWRDTMLVFGVGMLVIILPLSFLIRDNPNQPSNPAADGKGEKSFEGYIDQESVQSQNISEDLTVKNILMSRVFWHLAIAAFLYFFLMNAITVHFMPYFSSVRIGRSFSSFLVSAVPLSSIGGRLGFGWLGGNFDEKRLMNISWVFIIIGLVSYIFVSDRAIWAIIPFIIFFGIGWGGNTVLIVALVRKYFGSRKFGTAYGFVMGFSILGGVTGAPLAGFVYDKWGMYQGVWLGLIGVAMLGIVAILTLPEPKKYI